MQYKTSRKEALAAGDIKYIGGPCKHGHGGLRYTRNHGCINCHRITSATHIKNNPEKRRELRKEYRKRYPEKIRANHARRRAYKLNRVPKWLTKEDMKAIQDIYAEATRKTLETGIPHHVDHIIPLRGKLISGLHVPTNLQVIPATQNMQKYNAYICK